MAISKKKPAARTPEAEASFIGKGLSKELPVAAAPAHTMIRFSKTQAYMLDQVRERVEVRKTDYPKASLNEWLVEAVAEKLAKEGA